MFDYIKRYFHLALAAIISGIVSYIYTRSATFWDVTSKDFFIVFSVYFVILSFLMMVSFSATRKCIREKLYIVVVLAYSIVAIWAYQLFANRFIQGFTIYEVTASCCLLFLVVFIPIKETYTTIINLLQKKANRKKKEKEEKEIIDQLCAQNKAYSICAPLHPVLTKEAAYIQAFPALLAIVIRKDGCITGKEKDLALNFLKKSNNILFSSAKEEIFKQDEQTCLLLLQLELECFLQCEPIKGFLFYSRAILHKKYPYDLRYDFITTLFEIAFSHDGIIYTELDLLKKIAKFILIKKSDLYLLEKKYETKKGSDTQQSNQHILSLIQAYKILEVENTASNEDIKQAYRRLAKQCHPDMQPKEATVEELAQTAARFRLIHEAYLYLCKKKCIV